mmetsp:Transcript_8425/g.12452  ORF Transcript_8425/g.12452 Transcript_8425/m.12452 type:complete len:237 (-) Transcript_8425:45-755(-)
MTEESTNVMDAIRVGENGKLATCSGKQLEKIPADMYKKTGTQIETIDLTFNNISTLEGLNRYSNLKELVLDNNQIESIEALDPTELGQLETLWLNNNKISKLENLLTHLSKFPKLRYLSLLKNPVAPNEFSGGSREDYINFRLYVLYRLKNLKFLDSRQVSSKERKRADENGQYCKVIDIDVDSENIEQSIPTDIPVTDKKKGKKGKETHSYFGYTKNVYKGSHSEGNRFIRNKDL